MKNLKLLPVFLISISCSLSVPDVPICTEITYAKGRCVNTVSSQEFVVDDKNLWNGQTWWDLRPSMVLVPARSWAEIKYFIIKVCKKTKQCDADIAGWDRTIEKIDANIANKTKQ